MTVFVNRVPLRMFRGAKVGDAILKYSEAIYREILARRKIVTGTEGNPKSLQDNIDDGDHIDIIRNTQLT
jgi:putative ubiquitin-RnfH superfamily antitoxin RatB of RatAB toxin-antitoxin module